MCKRLNYFRCADGLLTTVRARYCRHSTHCVKCFRPHSSVGTTTPVQSIASASMVENCHKYAHENAVKIVNKRPRNLLNKIQNVFINGKKVKTDKITQIIPWFSQFYAKTTTGDSHAHMYVPTVTFARLTTPAHGALRLQNQLAAPWNWVVQWVVEVSGCHSTNSLTTRKWVVVI